MMVDKEREERKGKKKGKQMKVVKEKVRLYFCSRYFCSRL